MSREDASVRSLGTYRLKHTVYRSFEQVRHLRREWDTFVENAGGDLFSSYDWCAVWWRHYGRGRRLQIHLFHGGSGLVAVLPLFQETQRLGPLSVRLVRVVGCDHSVTTCGLVIRADRLAETVQAVVEYLDRSCQWDLLHFGPLPGYYLQREALAAALARCPGVGEVVSSSDDGLQIIFELPDSYEAYLGRLSSNERNNIRKRELRLTRSHNVRARTVDDGDLDGAFRHFVEQHQAQWRHQSQLGHFGDWPGAELFHRDMAAVQSRRGRLMLLRLEADGEVLGYQYNYRFGRRVHWILTSRTLDRRWAFYSPGRLLHCAVVRAAIEGGARQIDGMRGRYEYKLRLGGTMLRLQSVGAIRRGFASRLRVLAARGNARLLDLLYYRIWFGRLARRIPYWQRPLWTAWIRSRI